MTQQGHIDGNTASNLQRATQHRPLQLWRQHARCSCTSSGTIHRRCVQQRKESSLRTLLQSVQCPQQPRIIHTHTPRLFAMFWLPEGAAWVASWAANKGAINVPVACRAGPTLVTRPDGAIPTRVYNLSDREAEMQKLQRRQESRAIGSKVKDFSCTPAGCPCSLFSGRALASSRYFVELLPCKEPR
jgi:hypothetical protein